MKKIHFYLLSAWCLVLLWSSIQPKDYFTWFLEVIPGVIGVLFLIVTYKKFKFSTFIYCLILFHCVILFVGGKYTYAENPLFEIIKVQFHMERNEYDKVGHITQGFVPTLIARELLLRLKIVSNKNWIPFLVLSIAMFISSIYELIEWSMAILTGEAAEAFLGTQGYIWDTQSDLFFAFIGSILALILFSKLHDSFIKFDL